MFFKSCDQTKRSGNNLCSNVLKVSYRHYIPKLLNASEVEQFRVVIIFSNYAFLFALVQG